MANRQPLTCARRYDLPLFCSSWATSTPSTTQKEDKGEDTQEGRPNGVVSDTSYVILGGGGGAGETGINNSLVLARFDHSTDTLSEAVSLHLVFSSCLSHFQVSNYCKLQGKATHDLEF